MRTMVRITMPTDAGNVSLKSGRLPQLINNTLAQIKPEAAYFTADGGHRVIYLFVDMESQSDLPGIAEPFFQEVNATVEFQPVMNADDLQKALAKLGR